MAISSNSSKIIRIGNFGRRFFHGGSFFRSPSNPTILTLRRFTVSISSSSSDGDGDKSLDHIRLVNPFQTSGPLWPFESKVSKGALHVRVDMPDVAADAMKVWTEENTVYFLGYGVREVKPSDESGRVYCGSVDLLPRASYFKTEQMVKEMKDAVLRLIVPYKTDEELKTEFGVTRIRLGSLN